MEQDVEGFGAYLAAIGKERLLSSTEEIALTRLARAGDRAAHERLITANLRLVIGMARRYDGVCDLTLDDLIQWGNLGLMRAVDKFNPDMGCRFSTFAMWWIRQSITRGIADTGRLIRVPVHVQTSARKLRRAQFSGDEDVTLDDIAAELDISAEQLARIEDMPTMLLSLDMPADEDSTTLLSEMLPAPEDGYAEWMESSGLGDALQQAMAHLTEREQRVLRLRYGLETGHALTLCEVGLHMGVTRERVRQIEVIALRKMRSPQAVEVLKGWIA